jgi:tetratricopeptide (TPR) repeat protein
MRSGAREEGVVSRLDVIPGTSERWHARATAGGAGARFGRVVLAVAAVALGAAGPTRAAAPTVTTAVQALRAGNAGPAIGMLAQVVSRSPGDAEAQFNLGLAYNSEERYQEAVAPLTRARSARPDHEATRFQLGLALVALERYAEAIPELAWLFERRPRTPDAGFYLGLSYFMTGKYDRAIDALQRNVSEDPRYAQLAAYYLGIAQSRVGQTADARESLARASSLTPASPLAQQARSALDQVGRPAVTAQPRRFRFQGQIAGHYDDNVRLAPRLNVFGLRDLGTTSPGLTLFLRPEYVLARDARSELAVHYAGLQTFNFDINELDFLNHQAGLTYFRPGKPEPKNVSFGVSTLFDHSDLGRLDFLERVTVIPFATFQHKPTSVTSAFASYQHKNFVSDPNIPDEVRDSDQWVIGGQHLFLSKDGRRFLKLGFQFDDEETDGRNYSYQGTRPILGGGVTFGKGDRWNVLAEYQRHRREYDNRNSIFDLDRTDEEDLVIARVEHRFKNPSWSAFGEYVRTDVDSTITLFSYDRDVGSIGVGYRY